MALPPLLYKDKYHIADTILKRQFDDSGKETFRGTGTDSSELSDNILYIMSYPLERLVSLKAFLESVKMSVSKSVDKKEEKDKQDKVINFHEGDLEIDVTLNLPAHSVNESVNNLAKIEELQRLIMPTSGYRGLSNGPTVTYNVRNDVVVPMFFVWFKNIISSGETFQDYHRPATITSEIMEDFGFPCMIESVNFEPDIEAGFFKSEGHLHPKNIKLNLKLTLVQEETLRKSYVIDGFTHTGEYALGDKRFFPFGVSVGVEQDAKFSPGGLGFLNFEMSTKEMNDISDMEEERENYLFISLEYFMPPVDDEPENQRRYVMFKPFINSFNRSNSVSHRFSDTKNRVGKIIDADESTVFNDLSYKMNITAPAKDLAEAKRNCAKVQYLMRMFYRTDSSSTTIGDWAETFEKLHYTGVERVVSRKIRVFCPSFIEGPAVLQEFVGPDGPGPVDPIQFAYDASVDLYFTSFSFDIDFDMGFFEEGGRLFPKVLTLDFEFIYDSGDLIKTYEVNPAPADEYNLQGSKTIPYDEQFFPYKRQTVKLGDN